MAVRMRLTRVGLEEEPDLPRRRGRLALPARRHASSRSSAATTRRPIPRRSSSTRTKVKDWLGKGAQPSDAVSKLIKVAGIGTS